MSQLSSNPLGVKTGEPLREGKQRDAHRGVRKHADPHVSRHLSHDVLVVFTEPEILRNSIN